MFMSACTSIYVHPTFRIIVDVLQAIARMYILSIVLNTKRVVLAAMGPTRITVKKSASSPVDIVCISVKKYDKFLK